jgi:protein TonB
MKKIIPVFLLFLSLKVRSQEKESFYVFDENWKPTKLKTAHFFVHSHEVNDSCWQWDFYNFVGPLIKTEQFGDKDANERNGVSYYYNRNGLLDSMTSYRSGKKNGRSWKMVPDSLKVWMEYSFLDDSLVELTDLTKKKNDTTAAYPDEKESEYPGGLKAWAHYLNEKFEYPERAMNSDIQGQVDVRFEVDKSGNVINCYVARSVEYSLDEEALKIIKESGRWKPSFQNGHNVKAYKSQPVIFKLR